MFFFIYISVHLYLSCGSVNAMWSSFRLQDQKNDKIIDLDDPKPERNGLFVACSLLFFFFLLD